MRKREYVKRVKRNWRRNTGRPEGENIKKVVNGETERNSKGHS